MARECSDIVLYKLWTRLTKLDVSMYIWISANVSAEQGDLTI